MNKQASKVANPTKPSIGSIEEITEYFDELRTWFSTNKNKCFWEEYLYNNPFYSKKKKKTTVITKQYISYWRTAYPWFQEIYEVLNEMSEYRLKNGCVDPVENKISNGCRFILQAKHGYVITEKVLSENKDDIKLSFEGEEESE